MKCFLMVLGTIGILAGCAPQAPLLKQTASGNPEGRFRNARIEDVRDRLVGGCAAAGLNVTDSGRNQVVCGKTMTGGDAMLAQMVVGNSYSTTPEQKVRFTLYQNGSNVHVTAAQWVETQMAFGQIRRQELTSNNQKNDLQQLLFNMGAD